MAVRFERCCGLDVHNKEVVACLLVSAPDRAGQPCKEIRRFGTMTEDLERLAAWLEQAGCTQVALESTGSYWLPVWNILEEHGGFAVLLVNPQQIKAYRRDKTDVKDAEWLADRLRHGLLRGSFVPGAEQRQWRDLTRSRQTRVQERTAEVTRLQKVLAGANITDELVCQEGEFEEGNLVGVRRAPGRRSLSRLAGQAATGSLRGAVWCADGGAA